MKRGVEEMSLLESAATVAPDFDPAKATGPAPATALAVQSPEAQMLSAIERMASSKDVDVDKFERFMAMREREMARNAEIEFNGAMSEAQKQMRPVSADATNPQTRSKYATYDKLDRALRPIYTEHGFGLSFDTADSPLAEHVRVLCYVTHAAGHARTYKADMPADGKGAKGGDVMTKTHAVGSAMSYGMRYLLKMIFNVAVGEDDDDGNRAGKNARSAPPAKYDEWLTDMEAVASEGLTRLEDAWGKSKPEFKTYTRENNLTRWEALKKKAAKVKA